MRGSAAQGQAEKGPSGAHPAAIMALAEPMALILIFSSHPGDTESHWNKRRERKLLSPLRHREDLTMCSPFMVLCFRLTITSHPLDFHLLVRSFLSLPPRAECNSFGGGKQS